MNRRQFLKSAIALPVAGAAVAKVAAKKPVRRELWYDGSTGEFQWVLAFDSSGSKVTDMRLSTLRKLEELTFKADSVKYIKP